MSRVSIFLLASALAPAALAAQTVSPPVPWEDTPQVRLNVPAAAAAPGAAPAPAMVTPAPRPAPAPASVAARTAPVAPAPALARTAPVAVPPTAPIRPAPVSSRAPVAPSAAPIVVAAARPAPRPVALAAASQHGRLQRGHSVGAFWRSPRVEVRNYGRYGLYPPAGDDRWVRYYDDALLVDRSGVVRDGRYGLDWDQYGDGWAEEGGIPVYVGDGDFYPGREDYAYVEGYDQDYAEADDYEAEDYRGEVHAHGIRDRGYSCQVVHGNGPPMPCEAGYRPGWVNDYPPGTVITETIVTTSQGYQKPKAHAEPRRRVFRKRLVAPPAYGERG